MNTETMLRFLNRSLRALCSIVLLCASFIGCLYQIGSGILQRGKNITLNQTYRIFQIRGMQVMLDKDLANWYGTETKRLIEQVKRNIDRFPPHFMFQLTDDESAALRSQIATLKKKE